MKSREIKSGAVFSRWTVLGVAPRRRDVAYFCRCTCGVLKSVIASNLISGKSKSCGCLSREMTSKARSTHGCNGTNSAEYRAWANMKSRCLDSSRPDFNYYGGRGIGICQQWVDSFESFLADMGLKPSREYSLDRINVNGNYEPSNCRWATPSVQHKNIRPQTHCKRGHEFTAYNTVIVSTTKRRLCRACREVRNKQGNERRRACTWLSRMLCNG